ncbi:MAG TPA: hypothetical protein H9682_01995, partial [Firmicutes bacterium]|nr:hypothetical protein [Bacillota bacterium]
RPDCTSFSFSNLLSLMYLEFVPAITHKYNLILYTPPVVKSISAGGGLRAAKRAAGAPLTARLPGG